MATKMLEVQQKLFKALQDSAELSALVTGVYDYVPESTLTPYVTFGQMNSSSAGTKTDDGEKLTVTLDTWSESKGRKEALTILVAIENALDVELILSSAFLVSQKVTNREVTEEAYGLYHAGLDVEIQLTWEEN